MYVVIYPLAKENKLIPSIKISLVCVIDSKQNELIRHTCLVTAYKSVKMTSVQLILSGY